MASRDVGTASFNAPIMADRNTPSEEGLTHSTGGMRPLNDLVPLEQVRFIIDRAKPIVEQVIDQLANLLVAGVLRTDDQLPTHDRAARLLGVSVGTVAAIYKILVEHGIATSSVGSGTWFTSHAQTAAGRFLVSEGATSLVRRARALGLGEEEVVGVFLAAASRIQNGNGDQETDAEATPSE
jgi:DNA-binding transcriptional regulator YhcF (GntR family)